MSLFNVPKGIFFDSSNNGVAFKRLFYGIGWQLYKRIISSPIIYYIHTINKRFILYPDCNVSSSLVYFELPDVREIKYLRSCLSKDDLFIDVGANVGHISILVADTVNCAHLFEPNPVAARRAEENLFLNKLESSFHVHQCGLSSNEGILCFENKGGVDTTNKVCENSSENGIEVPVTSLDTFLCASGDDEVEKRVVLKVDVEGHELEVFQGARNSLEKKLFKLIMFERLQEIDLTPIREILEQYGYEIFGLDDAGQPSYEDHVINSEQNLFAEPK